MGHIDEVFLFIPNRATTAGERPWKVVFASPDLGIELLEQVSAAGGGSTSVFAGRQTQSTVDRILSNNRMMSYQDAAQAKIDSIREALMSALNLTDDDIVEVPVLFEWHNFDGYEFAAAYNPGIQNLVVADDVLYVPDPEGPVFQGSDIFKTSSEQVFTELGLTTRYVDVFDSYHLNLGEAHCGTEMEGAPYDAPWWAHDSERR